MTALRRTTLSALAILLAACAGNPGPGEPGYPFNLAGDYTGQFTVEGTVIPAVMTLVTGAGGVVTGSFTVAQMGLTGKVDGTLVGSQLAFRGTYHNPESACDGTAESSATVGEGGTTLSGPLTVTECGQMLSGSFNFRR
jgi:hypothetical protein